MDSSDLHLLRLPGEAWADLTAERPRTPPFRYVVGTTGFTRTWRVALVRVATHVVGAVVVRKFGSPGRRQDGLEFKAAEALTNPVSWDGLVDALPTTLKRHLERDDGSTFPRKTGADLEAALSRVSPDVIAALSRMREHARPRLASGDRDVLIREQRDAVALGLEISGLSSRELLSEPDNENVPFLTGLRRRRVSEAATIRHDATVFDEWLPTHADQFDMATFRDPDDPARRVTVFYADKEDLERQTGTDLVYYRHHRPGFILVQYKRMRSSETPRSRPTYYPDDQLRTELGRLRALPNAAKATTAEDWRLTDDPFFIKLVRDDLAKPSENKLVRGMYLPLGLVELLLQDAAAGLRSHGWSPESINTYLSNEEFLQLAKQGYVGTRGATTEHLQQVILGSFDAGRGVVLTVDETNPGYARRLRHG